MEQQRERMTTFNDLGLGSEFLKSLDDLGYTEPSPIQEKAIPFILKSKKDLIALAQTGTGKTAAFSLPILNQLEGKDLQAIILCPTRELCIQIFQDIKKFTKYSKGIGVTAVYGGERIDLQIRSLRSGTNIVVGTPGRVHDLIRRKVLKLQSIQWLVLDEADEMLDMGFKDDLDAILEQTPQTRQTLLFSATMSRSVHSIAKKYMHDTQEIRVGEENVGVEKISHEYYLVQPHDRFDALKRILDFLPGVYGIIFCRTKNETQEVADKLKQAHYQTEALHGDVSQNMRTKIMDRFKRQHVRLLVATDVAARGIDVSNLSHVINYNLPDKNEAYTHRTGRTGRAQQSGVAISFVTPRELRRTRELESIIGKKIEYKKIPSGSDISRKQIDTYLQEIVDSDIADISPEMYSPEIVSALKKVTKDDLIQHIVAHKFNQSIGAYKNARDVNAEAKPFRERRERTESGDMVSVKINLGKRTRFDIKGLFALVNSNSKLKGLEIGRINLMPEYSIFSVDKKDSERVLKYLKGTNFKGTTINVSISSETATASAPRYPKKRSGGYERRASHKRSGFRGKRR